MQLSDFTTVEQLADALRTLTRSSTSEMLNVRAHGAIGDGSTDDSTAFQSAADALAAVGGGTLIIPSNTYRIDTQLNWPDTVHVMGHGMTETIIDFRGTGDAFHGSEKWNGVVFQKLSITHANNSNSNVDCIDAAEGANSCLFLNVRLIGKNGTTDYGVHIRGAADSDSSATDSHNNVFINLQTTNTGTEVSGTAVFFDGANASGKRLNANRFFGGRLDGFTTGCYIWGNGNAHYGVTFNGPCTGGAAVHYKGDSDTANNVIDGCYFDSGITGDKIKIEYDDASNTRSVVTVFGGQGVTQNSDITVVSNGNQSRVMYSLFAQNIFFGGIVKDDTNHANMQQVATINNDGILHMMAGVDYLGGRILLSGSSYGSTINAVSDSGGVSASVQDTTDAEFRVVKTSDGSSFTKLFVVTKDGAIQAWLGPFVPRRTTNTSATGNIQIDASRGNYFEYTLTGNVTFTDGANGANGQEIILNLRQDGIGGHTVSFSNTGTGGFKLAGGSYTMTSTANKNDVLKFVYDSRLARWVESSRTQNI